MCYFELILIYYITCLYSCYHIYPCSFSTLHEYATCHPIFFTGAQVENMSSTTEIFNNLWSTEALDTAAISDTVFHGYRRRTKLTEAEIEDQKLSSEQDGLLSGSRGRYKCGRCGQLKVRFMY
jgi:hypothetical protein